MQRCRLASTGLARRPGRRGLSNEAPPPHQPGMNPEEPPPPPPNVFATVGAMGAGALGAVFIAAVGVWGVFKMAFYVASETGRSMNADKTDASSSSSGSGGSSSNGSKAGGAAGDVTAASPLEPWNLPKMTGLVGPTFAATAVVGGGSSIWGSWMR